MHLLPFFLTMTFKKGKYYYEYSSDGTLACIFKIVKVLFQPDRGRSGEARVVVYQIRDNRAERQFCWYLYPNGKHSSGARQKHCPDLVGLAKVDMNLALDHQEEPK